MLRSSSSTRSLACSRSLSMGLLRPSTRRRRCLFSRCEMRCRWCERSASSASSRGRLRCMSQGGRWAIRAAATQGASSSAHAGFSRSHACTHRKAAEEVILSSCGGSNKHYRESEKARKQELGIFFSGSDSLRPAAAQPQRQCRSGPQRRGPHKELHHEVEGRGAWRSVSAQHPQLLQVALSQRPRVVSVEAVDLVVEGQERLRSRARGCAAARRPPCARCLPPAPPGTRDAGRWSPPSSARP